MKCKVCGDDTTTSHAELCNGCWEIGYQAEALIRRNREAAKILFAALTEKLGAGDEPDEWLIQDTRQIVGNCILWWGHETAGYTIELKEAGRFTESFAKSQRESDRAIPLSIAKEFASTHIRTDTGIRAALSDPVKCSRCGKARSPGTVCRVCGAYDGDGQVPDGQYAGPIKRDHPFMPSVDDHPTCEICGFLHD